MIEPLHHPNLNGLVELGNREGVDIRPTLLRVMTDLYVQTPQHSEYEERQFTELVLRLIDLVDGRTRAIVARTLSAHPTTPAAIRRRLLKDGIVAQASPTTSAGRSPKIADAAPIEAIAARELNELFFDASSDERRVILLNLPYAAIRPATAMTPAVARESVHRLESAALGHNVELFARELERALSISRELAHRFIEDRSGEPLVVVAVALGMPAAVLQRISLCLNPLIGQSVQRVYDLALLQEELERDSALRLVAIWQAMRNGEKKTSPARPVHQPLLWDDDSRTPAAPAARPRIRWDEYAQRRKAEHG